MDYTMNLGRGVFSLSGANVGLGYYNLSFGAGSFYIKKNYIGFLYDCSSCCGESLPGTWLYESGVAGTVTLAGNKKIKSITAIAQEASATMQINGGDIITLPYGSTDKLSTSMELTPDNLIDPTIIFTGTKSYIIEYYQL